MNHEPQPEEQTTAPPVEEKPLEEPSLSLSFEYWPPLIAGTLIASGIISIGTGPMGQYLVWVPPVILVGWIAIGYLTRPRPKVEEPEIEEPVYIPETPVQEAQPEATTEAAPAAAQEAKPAEAPKPASKPSAIDLGELDVVVLWGSESGNTEGLADMAAERLNGAGLKARSISMGDVTIANLPAAKQLLLMTSTWGDGEPPSNAIDLWEAMQKEKVDLGNTRFSVLSLGDTAYPQFCQCGKDFDAFLEAQGAQRIHPRVDCDLDFEEPFEQWFSGVSKVLQSKMAAV